MTSSLVALAHLGERQTEVFKLGQRTVRYLEVLCSIHRSDITFCIVTKASFMLLCCDVVRGVDMDQAENGKTWLPDSAKATSFLRKLANAKMVALQLLYRAAADMVVSRSSSW
ncbi:hypothetical protein CLAFUW4_01599 [Fulvia fulva]|uniref:Uncharacterized protein n=1 Tax=Passalora fulva TaxID=5499 RepID=A0A9Q8L6U7_PASFU|nr:uncharacterized protein CLAFUR5_01599 [Fulvia fulva]KAK4635638.1 hypothetical protein CLAFUR4_01597 [Fulvia fulva]KAK4637130.1 hypothetical protein CLAFUR0_01598 [Fulvia fulva]UJO11892.1 hypothetical protein CLAFUR5_01599 [Fulvia fulva]WPV08237.1 hypothetical protein CLAFUW4_01599 [Fulvia fulva]WPV23762.1 hypothetical protein CLAFUW7_01601 [Fulvia fulva]